MKKRLILFVVVFMGLQSNIGICAEKQTWFQWIKSKFFTIRKPEYIKAALKREASYATQAAVAGASAHAAPTLARIVYYNLGFPIASTLFLGTAFWVFMGNLLLQESLYEVRGGDRAVAVQKIKDVLALMLADNLLYPTRKSKIRVLLNRDDFLKYVKDGQNDNAVLIDACNGLANEVNQIYSDEQLKAEDEINKHIESLEAQITTFPSLEGQIAALERMQEQPMTIHEMRAYLSLYYRLKNQLQVEKGLTPEQKKIFSDISTSFEKRMEQQKIMREQELERLGKEKETTFAQPQQEKK